MAIFGLGRGDSKTLAGHLSRRGKTSHRNQVVPGVFSSPTRGKENPRKNRVQGHPLMSPVTEGGEQWPMRRVLPAKPTVHAPTTLWPCDYLWNGVVLSVWIANLDAFREAVDRKLQHWNCQKATSTTVLFFSTGLFVKQQRCPFQEESAETISPVRLSALLDPRVRQCAQGLGPSKREDGKLANKHKGRDTQKGKGAVHTGRNTIHEEWLA